MDSQEQPFYDRKKRKSDQQCNNYQISQRLRQQQRRQSEQEYIPNRQASYDEQSQQSDEYLQCLRCNKKIKSQIIQQHLKTHKYKRRKHKNKESRTGNKFWGWNYGRKQNLSKNINGKQTVEPGEVEVRGVIQNRAFNQQTESLDNQSEIQSKEKQLSNCRNGQSEDSNRLRKMLENQGGIHQKYKEQKVKIEVDKKIRKRGRPRKNLVIKIRDTESESRSDVKCNGNEKNNNRVQNMESFSKKMLDRGDGSLNKNNNNKKNSLRQDREKLVKTPYKLSRVQLLEQLVLRNKTYIQALQNHLSSMKNYLDEANQKVYTAENENRYLREKILSLQLQLYLEQEKKTKQKESMHWQEIKGDNQLQNQRDKDKILEKQKVYQSTINLIKIEQGISNSSLNLNLNLNLNSAFNLLNKDINPFNNEKMEDIYINSKQSDKQRTSEQKAQSKREDQNKSRHQQKDKYQPGMNYFKKLKLEESEND